MDFGYPFGFGFFIAFASAAGFDRIALNICWRLVCVD